MNIEWNQDIHMIYVCVCFFSHEFPCNNLLSVNTQMIMLSFQTSRLFNTKQVWCFSKLLILPYHNGESDCFWSVSAINEHRTRWSPHQMRSWIVWSMCACQPCDYHHQMLTPATIQETNQQSTMLLTVLVNKQQNMIKTRFIFICFVYGSTKHYMNS